MTEQPQDLPEPLAWNTRDQVRDQWADAPMNDAVLNQLMEAAHDQVEAYAPALASGAPVPSRYKLAELMQTKALGQAQDRDNDVIGFGDGFAVRVRPLSQDVKQLLRPRRGLPVVT